MIDLDELRKLAEAATPGPWEPCLGSGHHECTAIHFEGNEQYPYGLFVCDLLPDWLMDDKYKADVSFKSANMNYLCAANPATVLALLDVVEAARRCEWERQATGSNRVSIDLWKRTCDALARLEGKDEG